MCVTKSSFKTTSRSWSTNSMQRQFQEFSPVLAVFAWMRDAENHSCDQTWRMYRREKCLSVVEPSQMIISYTKYQTRGDDIILLSSGYHKIPTLNTADVDSRFLQPAKQSTCRPLFWQTTIYPLYKPQASSCLLCTGKLSA